MKIVHWTLKNGSGLSRMGEDLAAEESRRGHESIVLSSYDRSEWEKGMEADIHISHSHVPDPVRAGGKGKWVWIGHGTPEHCFQTSVEEGLGGRYGHADTWMLIQWWMKNADALVTFWPRHQRIWKSLCDKRTIVDCIPMGVDREFWSPGHSAGKYVGSPSVFVADNAHYIKWPLDTFIVWPWVTDVCYDAQLHCIYLPRDQHRWWFPLINRNGAGFKSYVTPNVFDRENLRNAFCSVDYLLQTVRYGDFNKLGLEAASCGCKVISFAGNDYADYWLTEGNQDKMVQELISIFKGEVNPLARREVPDIKDTVDELEKVYGRLL